MPKEALFTAPFARVTACVLGTLLATTLISSGASIYLPLNEIDRVGLPIVLFPVVWVLLLIASALLRNIWLVWGLLLGLIAVHAVLIYLHLTGG